MSKSKDYAMDYEHSTFDLFPEAQDVFVLGAGFSKAVHDALPTMADLNAVVQKRVVLPQQLRNATDFEFLLNYLAIRHPWLPESEYLRNRALYLEVARTITDHIRECSRSAMYGEPPLFVRQLLRYWFDRRSAVITFNYDTLIESFLLFEINRVPSIPSAVVTLGDGSESESVMPSRLFEGFSLHKLHGSVNWWYSGNLVYDNEPVYYYRPFHPGMRLGEEEGRDDAFINRTTHFSLEVPPVWDKEPFIVPPLVDKTSFFGHRVLRNEWITAARALAGAKRIFFVGYSLPVADVTVRFLLTSAAAAERRVECYVVNRNKQTFRHYESVIHAGGVSTLDLNSMYIGHDAIARMAADLTDDLGETVMKGWTDL